MFYHNLSDTDTILTRVSARLQQPQNTDRRRRYSKAVALLLLFTVSFATLLTGLRAVNANAVQLHPFSTSKGQGSSDKFPID